MEFNLILKKINGTLSPKEKAIFDVWYNEAKEHREYFHRVEYNLYRGAEDVDIEKAWDVLNKKLHRRNELRVRSKWFYSAVAVVAFFLVISTGFLIKNNFLNNKADVLVREEVDVLPGVNKATLILETGEKLVLEKNTELDIADRNVEGKELIYTKKSVKDEELKWNSMITPRGGQFRLILSDGTEVWLNSDTKIKYPVHFKNNASREVELIYGEAYFAVSPAEANGGNAFVVKSPEQDIYVMGTEFNIKSYEDEELVETTLSEGKVLVTNGNIKNNLSPGEQLTYKKGSAKVIVKEVDIYDVVAWRRGEFSFKNKPLKEIVKVLSRWYDIAIVIENKELQQASFNGVLSKEQKLKEILDAINKTTPLKYQLIEGVMVLK